jgi:hypothetical protein
LTRYEVAAVGEIMHCFGMMFDPGPIRRPNPLAPSAMTAVERRTELCSLLALGLARVMQREHAQHHDDIGEIRLHYPADRSVHATPTQRRTA